MWLYRLIKILPLRFPKNYPSIKIWKRNQQNVADALGVIKKGLEKLVAEIPASGKFKRQRCWERHVFCGRSSSSDSKDKATLKCPRFKVWTRPLEKKYGLIN